MQYTINKIHKDYRNELSQKYIELSRKMREKRMNFEAMVLGTAEPSRKQPNTSIYRVLFLKDPLFFYLPSRPVHNYRLFQNYSFISS